MSNLSFWSRITINFYVKLGKGENEACLMFSKGHGTEVIKKSFRSMAQTVKRQSKRCRRHL